MTRAALDGPNQVYDSGSYLFEISHWGGEPPFTYDWGAGYTTKEALVDIHVYPGHDYTFTLTGVVTDGNGITISVSKEVHVLGTGGLGPDPGWGGGGEPIP